MDKLKEQTNNSKPWLYKKGQSGNPAGRPKGSKTMKTYIQERFQNMTDEEREEFLDGLPKEIIWRMGEGNPQTDVTSKGEKINPLPILGGVTKDDPIQEHNGSSENPPA